MASISVPGFGTKLANGGTAGSSYTNVAQVTDTKLSLGKAKKDDITNFDSPTSSGGGTCARITTRAATPRDAASRDNTGAKAGSSVPRRCNSTGGSMSASASTASSIPRPAPITCEYQ